MIGMKFWKLPENARFSNKQLIAFLLPVLFEQLMVAGLGMADTFMVSSLGETAVAGVALVNRIDNFAKQFLVALGQGGSVVLSQYIGAENKESAQGALKNNIRIVVAIGLVIMSIMVFFKYQVLNLLFGGADPEVLAISGSYITVTAFAYPFIALYYSCSSSFRAMGESKMPFAASVVMMSINLVLKYLFIYQMDMGVTGAAFSTLLAMASVGIGMMVMLKSGKRKVQLQGILKFDFDRKMAKRILGISLPNGIEQGMFQLGALAIAGLVSGLGTTAIAADSLARSVSPLLHSVGAAFSAVMIMVVGQCMGAGKPEEAKMYVKHILKMDYVMTFADAVVFMMVLRPVMSVFGVSAEAQELAVWIMIVYSIGSIFAYPTSFAVAAALRGAGDTKFVMVVASASMFLFRIGAAYIFVYVFHLGVIGTWFAMVSDWVIRSTVFLLRYRSGKWKKNRVI